MFGPPCRLTLWRDHKVYHRDTESKTKHELQHLAYVTTNHASYKQYSYESSTKITQKRCKFYGQAWRASMGLSIHEHKSIFFSTTNWSIIFINCWETIARLLFTLSSLSFTILLHNVCSVC